MQTYGIGEPRQLTSTWYDANGDGVEPSSITLTVTHPDGTPTIYNKAQLTQGATTADWYRWLTPDALGVWRYDFTAVVATFTVEQGGVFLVGDGTSTSPTGPCEPWADWDAVLACASTLDGLDPAQREYALDTASEILFNLTGAVYPGICETTRSLCLSCRHCLPACCGCTPYYGIDLGIAAPVWGVWDVVVQGVTLPPSVYKVHDRRWLVRTDEMLWPRSSLTSDLIDPDFFRATWAWGRPIPAGGRRAAALFAAEIGKLCSGDASCKIPQRVTNLSREGVNFTILDSLKMIEEGRTGLALVDLWIVSDAKGRKARPGMFSPGAVEGHVKRVIA